MMYKTIFKNTVSSRVLTRCSVSSAMVRSSSLLNKATTATTTVTSTRRFFINTNNNTAAKIGYRPFSSSSLLREESTTEEEEEVGKTPQLRHNKNKNGKSKKTIRRQKKDPLILASLHVILCSIFVCNIMVTFIYLFTSSFFNVCKQTENAAARIKEILSTENAENAIGIRLGVKRRGCNGLSYTLNYAFEKPAAGKFVSICVCVCE